MLIIGEKDFQMSMKLIEGAYENEFLQSNM